MARPRSDIAPRVVHAARGRFLADGVDGASLREIAREAGTSLGMIYYYFPTKDDLFFAVVEEAYARVLSDLEAALAPAGAPLRERLRRAFARIGAASPEEADVMRLIAREALTSSARLDRLVARFARGHIALLMGAVAEGVSRGELRADVPLPLLLAGTMGVGAVPQIALRVIGERVPLGPLPAGEDLAARLVELLFEGVSAKPAPEGPAGEGAAKAAGRTGRPG